MALPAQDVPEAWRARPPRPPIWMYDRGYRWQMASVMVQMKSLGIELWDTETRRLIGAHPDVCPCGWQSPCGDWMVFGGDGRAVAFHKDATRRWTQPVPGHIVTSVDFRKDLVVVTSELLEAPHLVDNVFDLITGEWKAELTYLRDGGGQPISVRVAST